MATAARFLSMAMAMLLSAAATTAAPAPKIALPGCNAACGDVSVPYPFGFGPSHCYWPGLNLTCDTSSHHPPRLLLGDGTYHVTDIFVENATVRVVPSTGAVINSTRDFTTDRWDVPFGRGFTEHGYMLSYTNELVVYGCNVLVKVLADLPEEANRSVVGGCASICTKVYSTADDSGYLTGRGHQTGSSSKFCIHKRGCCRALVTTPCNPDRVQARWIDGGDNHTVEQKEEPLSVFVAERGWVDENGDIFDAPGLYNAPIVLDWRLTKGLPDRGSWSEHTNCWDDIHGYICVCKDGYDGNPYLAGGCQVINWCNITASLGKPCLGECINISPRRYKCQCPQGTHGDPFKIDGCSPAGLVIGLSVASGAALLPLVLGIIFVRRKIKQHKVKALKLKYFKQNRGQLLQQLVSQKADIAERMIIPLSELEKATNNFDKARELGGGGHGTVYKGILSDLHVVAIKKPKIMVQKEIDEFINEVAILSQINHRNVVKLFGCCLETEVPLLVYEFISNGTLYHHLHVEGPKSLPWSTRLRIATQIATALAYLHSAVSIPVIHRDIKSSNILLDDTLTAKVSDFGASRYIPIEKTGLTTRVQGTIGYLDPMYFYTGRLTEKSDVYSFGVILVELLTRKKPFSYLSIEGDGLVAHFVSLFTEGNLVQIMDPQVIDEGGEEVLEIAALAVSCINLRGEERPTMRPVEHTLEASRRSNMYKNDNIEAAELENGSVVLNSHKSTIECQRIDEASRRYSLEQEMMTSARYPR